MRPSPGAAAGSGTADSWLGGTHGPRGPGALCWDAFQTEPRPAAAGPEGGRHAGAAPAHQHSTASNANLCRGPTMACHAVGEGSVRHASTYTTSGIARALSCMYCQGLHIFRDFCYAPQGAHSAPYAPKPPAGCCCCCARRWLLTTASTSRSCNKSSSSSPPPAAGALTAAAACFGCGSSVLLPQHMLN